MPHLADLTWPDLDGVRPVLVVPLGSVEQHGPHLPVDTDTRIAAEVARRAVEAVAPTSSDGAPVLGPALPYGASGEREDFPGTVSIGQEALRTALIELGRSASRWAARLAIVNGHGGNVQPLAAAVQRLRHEGRDAAWFPCAFPGADAHAGATETSVVLSLDPGAVRRTRIEPGNTAPIGEIMDTLTREGVAAVTPNGVLGDPTGARAEHGERLVAGLAADLAAALSRWNVDEAGRLR